VRAKSAAAAAAVMVFVFVTDLLLCREGDFAKGFLLIIVVSCNVHISIFDCNKTKKNL
jgi:hypothetical protein